MSLAVRAVLTDLDNTLYNWVDFFAPSFRGMVHALAKELEVKEELIYNEFKKVYTRRGSLDYSFSVQEFELCRNMSKERIWNLVKIAKGAFGRVRQKRLVPYEHVRDTLAWLNDNAIVVVGISNAPIFHARKRLSFLKLDKFFYGLAGKKKDDIADEFPWTKEIGKREQDGKYSSRIKNEWELEEEELKPSSQGYMRVIEELKLLPKEICVVGDSLYKDLAPAMAVGLLGIWAKYGEEFDSHNFETLLRITHWSEEKVTSTYDSVSIKPDFTIQSFGELRSLIQPNQLDLLSI